MNLKQLNVAKVAAAIEADAGELIPGLRKSLAEAKAGTHGAVHAPKQRAARQYGPQPSPSAKKRPPEE